MSRSAGMLADEILEMDPDKSCVLDMSKYPRTLEEIGEAIGVTRERVRQIENGPTKRGNMGGALGKLRYARRRRQLEQFMGEGKKRGPDVSLDDWDVKPRAEG